MSSNKDNKLQSKKTSILKRLNFTKIFYCYRFMRTQKKINESCILEVAIGSFREKFLLLIAICKNFSLKNLIYS